MFLFEHPNKDARAIAMAIFFILFTFVFYCLDLYTRSGEASAKNTAESTKKTTLYDKGCMKVKVSAGKISVLLWKVKRQKLGDAMVSTEFWKLKDARSG